MTEYVEVFTRCWPCRDTGIMPPDGEGGATCVYCQGEGKLLYGHLDVTSLKNPTNVFEAYEILEAIDATEHDGLTATQKEGVSVMLSCGKVDLNVGKVGRVRLWNWFGAQSTTVTNLTAMLA